MKAHLTCTHTSLQDPSFCLTASGAVVAGAAGHVTVPLQLHRTGSFCDQEARPQPSNSACAAQLVHNSLAQSHSQTEGYGDSEQRDKQAAERQLASENN